MSHPTAQTYNAPDPLAEPILAGDRRALARAITLIESTRPDHRSRAEDLLQTLLPATGNSFRLGISGVPGVGKSTFIEAFGLHLIDQGHRVAVLAVDPSSPMTGGSILGDKTRMEQLSRHPSAFVRPSPSGGTLGGVARRTREVMLACEAQGYDIILVETVGVGQSETAVADLIDMFLLLLAPAAGDDLQGIKKGIVELADVIVVNKADGDLKPAAKRVERDYRTALGLLRPTGSDWSPRVLSCSALETSGISELWETCQEYHAVTLKSGGFDARRRAQAAAWMWDEVEETLITALRGDAHAGTLAKSLETRVLRGQLTPGSAARQILDKYLTSVTRPASTSKP